MASSEEHTDRPNQGGSVPHPVLRLDALIALYHTVEFEGGDSQEIDAFIGALGSQIPGGSRVLTQVDTNIPRSGDTGLQDGWEALVYSIQIEIVREMARNSNAQAFALQRRDEHGRSGDPVQPQHPPRRVRSG